MEATVTRTTADQTAEHILCALLEQPAPAAPPRPRGEQTLSRDVGIWSLRQHLERMPDDTYSRQELAQRYVRHGAHMAAVNEYRKLLCLDPHCYAARLELADCYLALELWQAAARELRLLTMVPGQAAAAWRRLERLEAQAAQASHRQVWELLETEPSRTTAQQM